MQRICSSKFRKRAELCKRNSKISTIRFFYSIFYAARCNRAACRTAPDPCSLQCRPFPFPARNNILTCSSAVVLHTREALTPRLARSRRAFPWITCAIVSKTTIQARFRFPPLLHQLLLITLVGLPSRWHPVDTVALHSAVPLLPPKWVLGGPRSIFPAPPCSRGAMEESDRAGDTASAQPHTPTPIWGTRTCATTPKNVREGSKKGTKGTAGRPGSSAGTAEKKQDRKRSEI